MRVMGAKGISLTSRLGKNALHWVPACFETAPVNFLSSAALATAYRRWKPLDSSIYGAVSA
jgi:hypothetical protein